MTLDDMIQYCEKVSNSEATYGTAFKNITVTRKVCVEEHKQLAEWLKDYKRLLEQSEEGSENDYIAEYVKEKMPEILGVDYSLWKFNKNLKMISNKIIEGFMNALDGIKIPFENENQDEQEEGEDE